jgi:hypothetical protein
MNPQNSGLPIGKFLNIAFPAPERYESIENMTGHS